MEEGRGSEDAVGKLQTPHIQQAEIQQLGKGYDHFKPHVPYRYTDHASVLPWDYTIAIVNFTLIVNCLALWFRKE